MNEIELRVMIENTISQVWCELIHSNDFGQWTESQKIEEQYHIAKLANLMMEVRRQSKVVA